MRNYRTQEMPAFTTLAGTPAAKQLAGMSLFTTLPAAITEPSPMVTPLNTVTFIPIQTRSQIVMGEETGRGPEDTSSIILWLSESRINTRLEMTTSSPMVMESKQSMTESSLIEPLPRDKVAPLFTVTLTPARKTNELTVNFPPSATYKEPTTLLCSIRFLSHCSLNRNFLEILTDAEGWIKNIHGLNATKFFGVRNLVRSRRMRNDFIMTSV